MPVIPARDLEDTRRALEGWLAVQLPRASKVGITSVELLPGNPFSTETMLVDATWTAQGRNHERRLVMRVGPAGDAVLPRYDLDAERLVIEALGRHTDVPVPEVYWHAGADDSPLGPPLFVMERVVGRTPTGPPPHRPETWLRDASPDEQLTVYRNGLAEMVKIHRVAWKGIGLGFLSSSTKGLPDTAGSGADPEGATGATSWRNWVLGDRRVEAIEGALAWLEANRPAEQPLGLTWGDARLGNIVYRDLTPISVLDWELADLGRPESDLGWWLVSGRISAAGAGDLPGFPDHDGAVDLYEEMSGRTVSDLGWFEVLAALRLSLISMRGQDLLLASGAGTEAQDTSNQAVLGVLEGLLAAV